MPTNSDQPTDLPESSSMSDQHRGYDLESGLIARVREWTDVFPWIRLARTTRAVASPQLILLTGLFLLVWAIGQSYIVVEGSAGVEEQARVHKTLWNSSSRSVFEIGSSLSALIPTSLFFGNLSGNRVVQVLWAVFLWTPWVMLLARQGALLTAGRSMMGLQVASSHVLRRTPAGWFAAFIPLACALMLGAFVLLFGVISRIAVFTLVEYVLALLIVCVAIPCGVLVFGANFAVPLGWSALAIEEDPDPLDSLSRGYEYLLRRPLQMILYLVVSSFLLFVVVAFASLIAIAAEAAVTPAMDLVGTAKNTQLGTVELLHWFPVLVLLTELGSLCGGVYLLLRYDAGGQEVEDMWQPVGKQSIELPDLPNSND